NIYFSILNGIFGGFLVGIVIGILPFIISAPNVGLLYALLGFVIVIIVFGVIGLFGGVSAGIIEKIKSHYYNRSNKQKYFRYISILQTMVAGFFISNTIFILLILSVVYQRIVEDLT